MTKKGLSTDSPFFVILHLCPRAFVHSLPRHTLRKLATEPWRYGCAQRALAKIGIQLIICTQKNFFLHADKTISMRR